MLKTLFAILTSLALLFLSTAPSSAGPDIVINEVMYNPNQGDDHYNEWIELYAVNAVNLAGWSICESSFQEGYIKRGEPVSQKKDGLSLSAGQYAVVTDGGSGTEVYDNFSVSSGALALHVSASSLCGDLSNSEETITLKDTSGTPVDSVTYSSSWGANGNGRSLERKSVSGASDDSSNWQESAVDGTPGSINSSSSTASPSPSPTAASYPAGIILSEFMPNPGDGNEWVELKNTSSSQAVLTDWKIDDVADGGGIPKKFSATIPAGGYYKVDVGSGFLNNSGDEVRLLYPDDSLADKTFYSNANKDISWIKSGAIWCEGENATPGSANSSCRAQASSSTSPTLTPTPTPSPKPTGLSTTFTGGRGERRELVLGIQEAHSTGSGQATSAAAETEEKEESTPQASLVAGLTNRSVLAGILAFAGLLLLSFSVFAFYKGLRSDKIGKSDEEELE